jgi:hypothetical protein
MPLNSAAAIAAALLLRRPSGGMKMPGHQQFVGMMLAGSLASPSLTLPY